MTDNELQHHGILGQRWGIRRYQNYDGTLTSAGKRRYDTDKENLKSDTKDKENLKSDTKDTEKKGLTDKQKKAIKIGAAVVGTSLAAYGGYKVYQLYTGKGDKIDPETGFRMLKNDMTDEQHLNKINPGLKKVFGKDNKYVQIIDGSSTNCMLCTTAFELRKRGLDIHAGLEETGRGYLPSDILPKLFKNPPDTTKISTESKSLADLFSNTGSEFSSVDPDKTYKKLVKSLSEMGGNGSRGNVIVWFNESFGGGHSMIWENVNGDIKFMDGQTGKVYKNFAQDMLTHLSNTKPIEVLRTDNLQINTASISQFMNSNTLTKTYVDVGAKYISENPQILTYAELAFCGTAAVSIAVNKKNNKKKGNTNVKQGSGNARK